jgi:protein-disulfide isomerase
MEEKSHESHSHKKKDETVKFEISKVRLWQGLTVILAIAVVFMWFNGGSGGQAQVPLPTQAAPGPSPSAAPQPAGRQVIDLDDDPVLGDPNAPVTIVSFEDYQCPFCGRAFQQTFPQLKSEYVDTGKAKIVFRDFPLSFHPEAQPAAEASECADEQGKFWEYHDALFNNQNLLGASYYAQLAGDLGLDVDQFTQCMDSGKYRQEVQADFAYGSQVGVSGTPTFFINGIKLVGAQPYEAFKQVIEAELAGQ